MQATKKRMIPTSAVGLRSQRNARSKVNRQKPHTSCTYTARHAHSRKRYRSRKSRPPKHAWIPSAYVSIELIGRDATTTNMYTIFLLLKLPAQDGSGRTKKSHRERRGRPPVYLAPKKKEHSKRLKPHVSSKEHSKRLKPHLSSKEHSKQFNPTFHRRSTQNNSTPPFIKGALKTTKPHLSPLSSAPGWLLAGAANGKTTTTTELHSNTVVYTSRTFVHVTTTKNKHELLMRPDLPSECPNSPI